MRLFLRRSLLPLYCTFYFFYKNLVHRSIKPWNCSRIRNVLVILQVVISIFFEGFRKKWRSYKQVRIHSYPSRVRVDRGRIWGHLITWAGAVRPKTAKKNKKIVWQTDRPTDRRTDRPTDGLTDRLSKRGVESPSTRLKIKSIHLMESRSDIAMSYNFKHGQPLWQRTCVPAPRKQLCSCSFCCLQGLESRIVAVGRCFNTTCM